jgi:squalene-hopene/tetraprenyl-beta-curcumene cyclase
MSIPKVKTQVAAPRFGRLDADLSEVQAAVVRSREFLLSEQHPDG